MSRLIEKLKKVSGIAPQPMGFRVSREEAERPRTIVIASVPVEVPISAGSLSSADAVILRGAEELSRKLLKEVGSLPFGLRLTEGKSIEKSLEYGLDFLAFPASISVSALKRDKIGKVLEIQSSIEPVLLRSANDLAVDAVLVAPVEGQSSLTVQDMMFLQLCAGLLEKPCLAAVPADTSVDGVLMLWEAGISGIALLIEEESDLEKLETLRKEIDKLAFPQRRKRKKVEPSLPSVSAAAQEPIEEEEEEEGE
jgi:hypothetical protein